MANSSACTDWKAWHDNQPAGPAMLYVTGKCTFPTSGYSVELRPHKPQGIVNSVYLLDKVVHNPTGPVNAIETTTEVRFSEETDIKFSEVTILPDNIHVHVEEVW